MRGNAKSLSLETGIDLQAQFVSLPAVDNPGALVVLEGLDDLRAHLLLHDIRL